MTTLVPRAPYTDDELRKLYPTGLELQLVQVLMRHGERTPVSARFQNAGLRAFWPYCASVRQMKSTILASGGDLADDNRANANAPFHTMEWKRRLEAFGENDEPVVAKGPNGELDDICDMGSLTDIGRQSTSRLGLRLRQLYVDRLQFLPPSLTTSDILYLRSTPVPRALESLHQTFTAIYPPSAREPDETGRLPVPTILTRAPNDETLYPNDGNCRRFAALSRAFAQRTAERWNATEEMEYLNKLYGKWMPSNSPRVAVDSRPRLSGIMDTINSTLAHGPETRLPNEFYDKKGREIIEKIGVEEWFSGYKESREYRMLGIGGLLGDIVGRMVGSVEQSTADGQYELPKKTGPGNGHIKFGLSGCHDTTLAAVLASLGAFNTDLWPPYTSHIAIEMFRKSSIPAAESGPSTVPSRSSWWNTLFTSASAPGTPPAGIGRTPTTVLTPGEVKKMDGYYVRLRYNDEPVTIPGCKAPGNHLEGDESFCTLAAFKSIVDKFTPQNWRQQCRVKAPLPALPEGEPEPAGY
ncbi:histidine phosphatase superfamily [Podospora appendiculata]|uniref:3-phytase n=1 Tax=Podospora appendiculata TaxID=314037 RepID=A0AAE1C8C0_9PEZI|nr:histidine phosphatase superfamily [Podospora appendiculata]